MARMLQLLSVIAIGVSLTGCAVSQDKYTSLKLDRDRIAEQLSQADANARAANEAAEAYKSQLKALMENGGNQSALYTNLQAQNAQLQAQYADIMSKYQAALAEGRSGPLPQDLSNTLTAFATANPDLVEFDAARGMVKFKSDVTFATGDATLTDKARDVLGRFATILNSSAASGYELMIAGHTDNQPVSNPATISKGHKDNWYLSSHRAISVAEALVRDRVGSNRIGVVGYGEQRPIAPNSSETGRAQNRRVEVLILPTTVRGPSVNAVSGQAPKTPAKAAGFNKDTQIGTESRPIIINNNK